MTVHIAVGGDSFSCGVHALAFGSGVLLIDKYIFEKIFLQTIPYEMYGITTFQCVHMRQ